MSADTKTTSGNPTSAWINPPERRIDVHVHISATTPPAGTMSRRLMNSVPFRFMRLKLGVRGDDVAAQQQIAAALARAVSDTPELDAVVTLAFDAVYDLDGTPRPEKTDLFVANDYVRDLAAGNPQLLFGASVHPYRRDAIAELERCVRGGAVLMKWLPIVQDFDPSHPKCIEFFEALAHHKLPLLSHTGAENALPNHAPHTASPELLRTALQRGVTVIMAHCGSRLWPWETDHTAAFMKLAREFENCFGDTSALNLPLRRRSLMRCLADPIVRTKLVHGSDWPILAVPSAFQIGPGRAIRTWREPNWLRRDVLIKQSLDFDPGYWTRASKILRPAPATNPAENSG